MSTRTTNTLGVSEKTNTKVIKNRKREKKPMVGDGIYDYTMNKILNTSNNRLFDGEQHGITYTEKDGYQPSRFTGPNTKLFERLKKGEKGLSYADEVSKTHDLRYSVAKNREDIRIADNKMIASLEKAKKDKLDFNFNINPALFGIKSKKILEDYFYIYPNPSSGNEPLTDEERTLYMKVLSEQEMRGFGRCRF